MFCPSCGTQILNEQKYCRACGMELEPVAALLAVHARPSPSSNSAKPEQEITFRAVKLVAAGASFFFAAESDCAAPATNWVLAVRQSNATTVPDAVRVMGSSPFSSEFVAAFVSA